MQYTKVKKIEKVTSEPVFHMTVEKNHNFVANDIIVHNCDYRGDVGLIVLNTDSVRSFVIKDGERLAQGVLSEVKQCTWETVESVEDLGKTDRGAGGYGHTGTK